MTDRFRLKLSGCISILNEAIQYPDRDIADNHPSFKYNDIKKHLFNIYNLKIPNWLLYCLDICCCEYKHMAAQIFLELMNSINARKFDDTGIPSDYIILPEDWIECFEDGYPICTEDAYGCFEYYRDSYGSFMAQITEYLSKNN